MRTFFVLHDKQLFKFKLQMVRNYIRKRAGNTLTEHETKEN